MGPQAEAAASASSRVGARKEPTRHGVRDDPAGSVMLPAPFPASPKTRGCVIRHAESASDCVAQGMQASDFGIA
jgi:hypothetical protein